MKFQSGKWNGEVIINVRRVMYCVSSKMRNEVGYVIGSQVINFIVHECQFLSVVPSI